MNNAERASSLIEIYGNYPMAVQFASNDSSPELQDSEMPAYDAAFEPDPTLKRHAACDECRKRKLKCSGEPAGCGRCIKQNLTCHYSLQKQMGRPRKRQKTDKVEPRPSQSNSNSTSPPRMSPSAPSLPEPAIDPGLAEKFSERSDFESVCTGPIAQSIKRANISNCRNAPNSAPTGVVSRSSGSGSSHTPPYDTPDTPPEGAPIANISYPTDARLWPDFSDMTSLPMPLQEGHRKDHTLLFDPSNPTGSTLPYDPDADPSALLNLPSVPECPCLPNSYLTLSTLSTLSAFPVSSDTVDTLLSSLRTTKACLYCNFCPQKFQSGSQNVMLSSVLINVMADQWHRIRKATAHDLKRGFGQHDGAEGPRTASSAIDAPMSIHEELAWRTFGYNLIRAHVFGDAPVPQPPDATAASRQPATPSSSPVTLLGVHNAFERRQKQWHEQEAWTGEFPRRFSSELQRGYTAGMTLAEIEKCHHAAQPGTDAHDFLCLRIADASRRVVMSLDTGPPTVEV